MHIQPINQFYGLGPSQAKTIAHSAITKIERSGTAQEFIAKLKNVLLTKDGKISIPEGFDSLPEAEKTNFLNAALAQKVNLKK